MEQSEKTLDMIVNLCKNRGYVFPGSEIYGGLANSWDYGPLGVEFKNNVKKAWLKKFVQESPYNVGLELNAQRAVVPAVCKAAVDLGTGENITTVLAEIDDHIKGLFALFHCNNILSVRGWLAVSCVFGRAAFPTAA